MRLFAWQYRQPQNGQKENCQHHYNNDVLLYCKTPNSLSTIKINDKRLMQPNWHEFNCQTNSIRKHINNVLLTGDINPINALQKDLAPGCRIQTIRSNRYQALVKSINKLIKFNCYIICFSFCNNVENEILSIINAVNNKNHNALINVTESIYSSNNHIRKLLLDLRLKDVHMTHRSS